MKVARNDPALAHALTASALHAASEADERFRDEYFSHPRSVGRLSAAIRPHYGDRLLQEDIRRAKGSRARATWYVLEFEVGEKRAGVRRWMLDARYGIWPGGYHLYFDWHALARQVQRTVGSADTRAVARLIARHLRSAEVLYPNLRQIGDEGRTVCRDGAFIWVVEAHCPDCDARATVAKTWISRDLAVEPGLREVFAQIGDGDDTCYCVVPAGGGPESIDPRIRGYRRGYFSGETRAVRGT